MHTPFNLFTQCGVVYSSLGGDSTQLSDPYPPLYSQTVNYYCPLHNYKAKCKYSSLYALIQQTALPKSWVMQSVYAILFLWRDDVCLSVTLCRMLGSDFLIRQQ